VTVIEETPRAVALRRQIRARRERVRAVYAPLSAGWAETKEYLGERTGVLRRSYAGASPLTKLLVMAIPVIFILALPQLPFMSAFYKTVLVDRVLFYVLLALGLNVVVGFAGLLDLGYVAFYAIGAYVAAYLSGAMPVQPPVVLDPFLTFPFALIVTMLAGVLLGLPTLRLRGDYLAIVTLGFHEIVRITLNNADPITNGARGIPAIPQFRIGFMGELNYIVAVLILGLLVALLAALLAWRGGRDGREVWFVVGGLGVLLALLSPVLGPRVESFGQRFEHFGLDPIPYYYLTVAVCALMVFIVNRLSNSRVGRAWVAIREDEIAAEAMGVPTLKMKIWAFAIGSSTAGFAGVLLAVKTSFISPQNFILLQSIIVLAMVVFGGMGSILGAIVGAVFIGMTTEALRDFAVVPFGPMIMVAGIIAAVLGLLVVARVLKPRAGPPFGYWLLGVGVVVAAAAPILRIPFLRIAQRPDDYRLFLLGLILVAVMVLRPEGLVPSRRRAMELHGEATAGEAKLTEADEHAEERAAEKTPLMEGPPS
jgi:ABC-type branched-subunit amino acid transport system permease subunit